MTRPTGTEAQRAQFEEYFLDKFGYSQNMYLRDPEWPGYRSPHQQGAWEVWLDFSLGLSKTEIKLASAMLSEFSEVLGNNGCNDWGCPDGWSKSEWYAFKGRFIEWNLGVVFPAQDYAVAEFLAAKLKGE